MVDISGKVQKGFEPVADAFAQAFDGLPDMGAALSVHLEGEPIIDLWGGVADERDGSTWERDTPSVIFSCTKGLVSILAAHLVDEGRLDYAAPVARYWPEFAQAGKGEVTVGEVFAHQAGLAAPVVELTIDEITDWGTITSVLAAQTPLWPRGSGYAYHTLTHGWLTGEIVRRVTGMSVGQYFADLITRPLHADAWIGYPADGRPVAHLQVDPELVDMWAEDGRQPAPNWPFRAMTVGGALPGALATPDGAFNDVRLQRAEVPGAGGIATANALSRIWSATVVDTGGVRLLSDAVIQEATRVRSSGAPVWPALPPFAAWGYGFEVESEARKMLGPTSFGHGGAGGQIGFADREKRVGLAFVTNWMKGPDERSNRIIKALRDIL